MFHRVGVGEVWVFRSSIVSFDLFLGPESRDVPPVLQWEVSLSSLVYPTILKMKILHLYSIGED